MASTKFLYWLVRTLGLYSDSHKTCYRQISKSLERCVYINLIALTFHSRLYSSATQTIMLTPNTAASRLRDVLPLRKYMPATHHRNMKWGCWHIVWYYQIPLFGQMSIVPKFSPLQFDFEKGVVIFSYIILAHIDTPDSKVHGANMGPTWVLSAPDGPNVGPRTVLSGTRLEIFTNSISNGVPFRVPFKNIWKCKTVLMFMLSSLLFLVDIFIVSGDRVKTYQWNKKII